MIPFLRRWMALPGSDTNLATPVSPPLPFPASVGVPTHEHRHERFSCRSDTLAAIRQFEAEGWRVCGGDFASDDWDLVLKRPFVEPRVPERHLHLRERSLVELMASIDRAGIRGWRLVEVDGKYGDWDALLAWTGTVQAHSHVRYRDLSATQAGIAHDQADGYRIAGCDFACDMYDVFYVRDDGPALHGYRRLRGRAAALAAIAEAQANGWELVSLDAAHNVWDLVFAARQPSSPEQVKVRLDKADEGATRC